MITVEVHHLVAATARFEIKETAHTPESSVGIRIQRTERRPASKSFELAKQKKLKKDTANNEQQNEHASGKKCNLNHVPAVERRGKAFKFHAKTRAQNIKRGLAQGSLRTRRQISSKKPNADAKGLRPETRAPSGRDT